MNRRKINCRDKHAINEFHRKEPFSKLLYYMIKENLVKIGPSGRSLTPRDVRKARFYKSYAVAALLCKWNGKRKISNASEFATLVLSKLVTLRKFHNGWKRLVPCWDIRNAGASLVFLRYHLKLSEEMFLKNGELRCTARQLYEENFDMLFCLRAGFDIHELSQAGFSTRLLENEYVQRKDEHGNFLMENDHLRVLNHAGFRSNFYYMNFTLLSLKESGVFTSQELTKLREIFEYHRALDEYNTNSEEESMNDSIHIHDEELDGFDNVNTLSCNLMSGGQPLQSKTASFFNLKKRISLPIIDQIVPELSSSCDEIDVSRNKPEQFSLSLCSETNNKVPNPLQNLISGRKITQKVKISQPNLYSRCSEDIDTLNITIQTPWSLTRDAYERRRVLSFRKGLEGNSKCNSGSLVYIPEVPSSLESPIRVVYRDSQSHIPLISEHSLSIEELQLSVDSPKGSSV